MPFDEQNSKFGMAPEFAVMINDIEMPQNIGQFVTSLEYENMDQAVDKISMELANPDFHLTNRKFLLPGNVISLYGGYGKMEYMASGIVTNLRANFPESDMPSIQVTAYSKDHFMSQRMPDLDQRDTSNPRQTENPEAVKKGKYERVWGKTSIADAVKSIAQQYNFFTSDDEGRSTIDTPDRPLENLYQVQGLTDFEFVTGLANLLGWYFWVDADIEGRWRLHFKSPKSTLKSQKKVYTLKYNFGDASTLLSFEPEMLITDMFTKVAGETFSSKDGKAITSAIAFKQGQQWSPISTRWDQTVEGPINKPSDVKIYMGDYAISVPDTTGFQTAADLDRFLKVWVERHENTLMMAAGQCVGLELLRARQVHKISNVGMLYDGDWLFDTVRHKFSSSSGYTCDFHARRIDKSMGET